jgi:uroporphyrinogen-III synthase
MQSASNEKTYALFSTTANRRLAAALSEAKAKVFEFEPIEIRPLKTGQILFDEFDWIIFPDLYAVDFFLSLLEENSIDLFELDAAQVLTLGEAVADRLRFVQLHADVIPPTIETETIFAALTDYLGKENLNGLRVVVPKESDFDFELKDKLIDAGATVKEIAVYQASVAEKNVTANLKALLKGGAIDEFIISAPEDVVSLKHYLSPDDLRAGFAGVRVSGTNEISMQTLRENNLRPHFFHIK